jgi:hypothetical protein
LSERGILTWSSTEFCESISRMEQKERYLVLTQIFTLIRWSRYKHYKDYSDQALWLKICNVLEIENPTYRSNVDALLTGSYSTEIWEDFWTEIFEKSRDYFWSTKVTSVDIAENSED